MSKKPLFSIVQTAEDKVILERRKKGKSPEQKQVIDFFAENGGCLSSIFSSRSSLAMDQYIKMVQDKCNQMNFRQRALSRINLDESQIQEIPPIQLSSFVYDGDDILLKVENRTAVSNKYAVTWIFFSATQIFTYEYIFDMTSDSTWEHTNDLFYSDVTCFTTTRRVRESITITEGKGCGCLATGEKVTKNNYITDSLKVIVPGATYSFSMVPSETGEQSIQAAKAMLRDKRNSE